MDKLEIQTILTSIFDEIVFLLTSKRKLLIDLDILGTILVDSSGMLEVTPLVATKPANNKILRINPPNFFVLKLAYNLSKPRDSKFKCPRIFQQIHPFSSMTSTINLIFLESRRSRYISRMRSNRTSSPFKSVSH